MNTNICVCNIDNFGSHISFNKTMKHTIENCITQGMYSCQIFLGNKLSLKRSTLLADDIKESNNLLTKWNINMFSHIPYCINLSGKSGEIAYTTSLEATNYAIECVKSIQSELDTLHLLKCKCKGCVVHIGSIGKNTNIKKGLDAVVESINKLNLYEDTPLCLETMVGCGGVLGKSLDELKYIVDRVDKGVGICLDTCHLFAEGLYKLNRFEDIDKLFNDVVSQFGEGKVKCIHFNDSKDVFGSKKDRHECIGKGEIWKTSNNKLHDSCRYFIDKCVYNNLPIILETVEEDYKNVVQLYNKET
jgi:deoxyribonuclease-4